MIPKEFKYNPDAKYSTATRYPKKKIELIKQTIYVSEDHFFNVGFQDLFEGYKMPYVKYDSVVQQWHTNPMIFWQNQLHFALWCATTGSGVDYNHHLKADTLTGSLYTFHVYYQTRRILKEMSIALPQQGSWKPLNNPYDRIAFERICSEFNVDPNSGWKQKEDDNKGLGRIYQWLKGSWRKKIPWLGDYYAFDWGVEYDTSRFTLSGKTTNEVIHIDFIAQGKETENAWTTLVLDSSEGFTQAGISRLNESIRTYSWALLDAQVRTRTGILGIGKAFDAQKQFIANVEDSVNSPVDLPSQVVRYQNTLKYAKSKVDFVFGIGLYMAPGNLEMQIGIIEDYNNEIIIAGEGQELGINQKLNTKPVSQVQPMTILGTPTKKSLPEPVKTTKVEPAKKEALEHEDQKTSMILGSVLLGITAFIIYELY